MDNENKSDPAMSHVIQGRDIARNTVINFIGLGIPIAIGFVTIPITIRYLGLDRFAVLSLAWVIVGYFSFFDLGLGRSVTKFIAQSMGQGQLGKVPGLFWTAVYSQIIMGIASAFFLALANPFLVKRFLNVPPNFQAEMMTTFFIVSLSMPIVFVSSSFRGMLEAAQRFDLVNMVRLPSSALNFLMPVLGGLLGMRLPGIMILIVVSRLVALVVWLFLVLRLFPVLRTHTGIRRDRLKPLFVFGGWVTVSTSIGPLLGSADKLMIGSILTLQMVSFYSPPFEMIARLGIIPGSLVMTLFPAFSYLGLSGSREKLVLFFNRSIKYLLVILGFIIVPFYFLSKTIIALWLGRQFIALSTPVMQILIIGFLMNSLAQIPFGFLQGLGRADITAKFHIIEALGYIPLLWFLILKYGIKGAAIAWTLRVTLDMILLFIASFHLAKIKYSTIFEHGILDGGLILLFYFIISIIFINNRWGYLIISIFTLCYICAQWLFALNKDERNWFINWVRTARIFRKG